MLYLHGYQSYIWNRVASRRLKEFGMEPIVGDLVYKEDLKDVAFKEENQQSSANGSVQGFHCQSFLVPTLWLYVNCSRTFLLNVHCIEIFLNYENTLYN